MRIAIIGTRGFPSTYGGYETFVAELGPRLAARGHAVTVINRRGCVPTRRSTFRGVGLVNLPGIETRVFSTLSHLVNATLYACLRRFDVVLACNVLSAPFCPVLRLFGHRTVLNVDGLEWQRPQWGRLARAIFKACARLSGRTASILVTDSRVMQQVYATQFGFTTTYIGYGLTPATDSRPDLIAGLGLRPRQYALVVTRDIPDNNTDLIIQAFNQIESDHDLAIAGMGGSPGSFSARLRSSAGERVRFLGHIADNNLLQALYCNAYVYVHGHEHGGTNPSLLQALGAGASVLALDTPFNAEVLRGTGLLFKKEPGDLRRQMVGVLADPGFNAYLKKQTRENWRAHDSWDQVTDKYEALFHQVSAARLPVRPRERLRTLA